LLTRRWWHVVPLAALLIWPSRTTPLFDFHSNFWVNLHQVLLHEAWLRAGPDRSLQGATPLTAADMGAEDEATWNAAVSFYAAQFPTRQQLRDDRLISINDSLAAQPDDGAHLNPTAVPPDIGAVLRRAAVIYRKYWWPAHHAANQQWIASQKKRVQDLGPKLASAMTTDLREPWSAAPIRVDVCHHVAALGYAFTTLQPSHITISNSDPYNQDLARFEVLFHEASHTFADTIMSALAAECRARNTKCDGLWHAALFYTSGVELRRLLPAGEQASFTPYAYANGVYTRGDWVKYRVVLEKDWQAYLDGKLTFSEAIPAMITDLR